MSAWCYSLSRIAEAVGGRLLGDGARMVESVSIDSRGSCSATSLFIALRGPRHDGHDHIAGLALQGLRAFMVEEGRAAAFARSDLIVVPDTLLALQRFAAWHRAHFNLPVVGITGSNGKTVVKEWLWQMLRSEELIVRSPGSWNSQVGVPLSVLEMGPAHTLGLFEAGISTAGEMDRLRPVIRPTIGVLTNIGAAHGDGFTDDHEKCAEKLRLFKDAHAVVLGTDNTVVRSVAQAVLRPEVLRDWSHERDAFVRVLNEVERGEATAITLLHAGKRHEYLVPFTDAASRENALTCITLLLQLGRDPHWINEALPQLSPVDMRMRSVEGAQGSTLIDDSYSNDPTSLRIALDHLAHMAHGRRRVVVLSDMLGSGLPADLLYQRVAHDLSAAKVDHVIGVGPSISAHRHHFPPGSHFHVDADALLRNEEPKALMGAVVLVKGARDFRLERVVRRWQQHSHGTELEVDLGAIRHNLNHYRAIVGPDIRLMAMVKAAGYGCGALELARLFDHERIHYLGVAYADEGVELRRHGITVPILVMNPEPIPLETLQRFHLEPEVYDERSLAAVLEHAASSGSSTTIHIKLDTGMHRLGFTAADMPWLLEQLRDKRMPHVASILSHLAASEDPAQDDFTRGQIAAFSSMATRIGEVLGYRPLWHIANSGAVSRFPEARLDMVRLGIGLHGVGVDERETRQLMPVATLRTVIAQLRTVAPGESVSYGRRFIAQRETRIATLPIGYADGLARRLGNAVGKVWINDKAAPFVGTICMDMCMVDVTDLSCSLRDEVIIFGPGHPLQEYACDLGTIPYEALTSISPRVRRVYVQG